jgi:endonuclease/exonuclease/phosphatase family metal-dependent hydrolase
MIKKTILFFLFTITSIFAQDSFRVMTYNLLNYPSKIASTRNPYFKQVVEHVNPDILVVQEMESISGVSLFLEQVLDTNYTAGGFIDGYTTDNAIFYKQSKFEFLDNTPIKTALRDISQLTMVYRSTSDTLIIYSAHLKASDGSENEQKRLAEVTNLRAVTDKLPVGTDYIMVGDFNVYSGYEPAFQKLLDNSTSGYFLDPINKIATWHNSSIFRGIHTQSTRTTNRPDEGSTGGLDDRFDFILISQAVRDSGGFTYIPGSYTAVGNDGNHFNRGLNELPNTKVSDEIATALYYSSDHLPVYADFLVETLTGLSGDPFNVNNDFELFQNYPNPFNPATTIKFSIPSVDDNLGSAGIVELRVFDILGREVANLLNEPLTAGNYTVNFNSGQINRQITSGVYYYQLRFGEFIETKKMIVLK